MCRWIWESIDLTGLVLRKALGNNSFFKHNYSALSGVAVILFASGMYISTPEDANAQSRAQICRALNQQLASLGSGGSRSGNSAKYRQYSNAVRKQQVQINKTKRAARRSGCVGLLKNRNSQCRRITSSLKKMTANLRNLRRGQAQFAPSGLRNAGKRDRILRELGRNRCNALGSETRQAELQPQRKSRRRTLLEQIFGVRTYRENGQRAYEYDEDAEGLGRGGQFRSLCVRKTDGYYFPISFQTSYDNLAKDDAVCQAMCPGSEVGLYYHRMPGQDSEDMIAYGTEQEYASEPFAFAYRKSHNPENTCRFAVASRDVSISTSAQGQFANAEDERKLIGTPKFQKNRAFSPDAYVNAELRITSENAKEYLKEARKPKELNPEDRLLSEDNRKIRIVGPAFFPVQ